MVLTFELIQKRLNAEQRGGGFGRWLRFWGRRFSFSQNSPNSFSFSVLSSLSPLARSTKGIHVIVHC
jgi:hypothetical protein